MAVAGREIAVVGAGIAGLACALALARRGARVVVLEQAPAIAEVGAGLQISPNGMRVLAALGLDRTVAATGIRSRAVSLRSHRRNAEVFRMPLGPDGPGFYLLHRADLVSALATAVLEAGAEVQVGARVEAWRPGDRPRVELADGAVDAEVILGADGLHSGLRPVLNGVAAPFFTGQVAWRAVVPNLSGQPPEAWVQMGPGRHLVSYPLRDGLALNLVGVEERRDWAADGWNHTDAPENFARAFAGFGGDTVPLIARASPVGLWGLFRHPVARVWHGPGVALLGDAAHPTLPFLAQGANLGLEDAWVLADCLDRGGTVQTALAEYQVRREARVRRAIEAANANARNYHLRGASALVAHAGLRAISAVAPARMAARFDWLYDHDVTAG